MGRNAPKSGTKSGKTTQYNTIRVRLFPTEAQKSLFEKTFGCCRYIWNQMLADQERFYLETGKHFLPTPAKYKKIAPFLTEVDHQTLTQEYNKLSQAFRHFFKQPEHFHHPKFKRKKDDRDTFTACNQFWNGGSTIYITKDGVRMTKAGIVKASFPRRPRSGWRLTRLTVEKTKTGKYYGCLLYECPANVPEPVEPTPNSTLALKYSPAHFYVTDRGETADPPKWLAQSQEKLAKLQKKLAKQQNGSQNYLETVQKYRLLHEHIANQRKDFIHKETRRIANEWDAVCMREDALVEISKKFPGMGHNGFRRFRETLRYKLERQGKHLLLVDRYYPSTKTCSVCGTINDELEPTAATWWCLSCGTIHQREENAAKNIKLAGLRTYQAQTA